MRGVPVSPEPVVTWLSWRAVTPPPDTDAVPTVPVPAIDGEPACWLGLQPGRVDGTATVGCCAALGLLDGLPAVAGGATALGLAEGARTVGPIVPPDGAAEPGDAAPDDGDDAPALPALEPPELAPPDVCASAPDDAISKAATSVAKWGCAKGMTRSFPDSGSCENASPPGAFRPEKKSPALSRGAVGTDFTPREVFQCKRITA